MAKPSAASPAAATLPTDIKPAELAERLNDPAFRQRIEDAIGNLPPDKAAELVVLLEASINRRKIEMLGYLAAAGVMLVGMVIALYVYGKSDGTEFLGWVFLFPLALAGLVMILVARWARRSEAAARARDGAPPTT
ncbi:MAG: hypothetical protein R3B06_22090 [Kofleriaceae bacterium]